MTSVTVIGPPESNGGVGMYTTELSDALDAEDVRRLPIGTDLVGFNSACLDGALGKPANVHLQYTYEIFGPAGILTLLFLPVTWILTRVTNKELVLTMHEVWDEEDITGPFAHSYATVMHIVLYLFTDTLVFLSEGALQTFKSHSLIGGGEVIPHGAKVEQTTAISAPKEMFGFQTDTFLVTQHGYVNERKGYETFIEIAKAMPDQAFLLAGGPRHDEFQEYFDGIMADSPDNVQITGVLDTEEFHGALQASDLALLPYDSIFQSGILNWCAAYELPVLASDIEYFRDLSETHGAPELFADKDDAVETIRELRSDAERRQILGRRLHRYAQQNSFEKVAEMNRSMYK